MLRSVFRLAVEGESRCEWTASGLAEVAAESGLLEGTEEADRFRLGKALKRRFPEDGEYPFDGDAFTLTRETRQNAAQSHSISSDSHTYPRKPDDSCDQSEIYPTSTRISPSTPIELVQGNIFFGDAQGDLEKNDFHTERVGPLGEIRVDAGILRVDCEEGVGKIGEIGPEMEVRAAPPPPQKRRDPHLTPGGTLVIPFDSDPKYHWWKGGQTAAQTRAEVLSWRAAECAG